jgi:hypothetical protein
MPEPTQDRPYEENMEDPSPVKPVTGVDTGHGIREDVEAVHKRILELREELTAEIKKLGTDANHEVNMALSYMDSTFNWVKIRVKQLT